MLYKILLTLFIVAFVSACSTTKDTADSSGSGSSGEFNTATTEETTASSGEADSGAAVVPGSQEDLIVNVGDRVFFGYDSAELDADAQELLQHQAAWFKQHNILSVTIEGHCDERGTREYNLALGEKSAQAVKNYLKTSSISCHKYYKLWQRKTCSCRFK